MYHTEAFLGTIINKKIIDKKSEIPFKRIHTMDIQFTYIDREDALLKASESWKHAKELGIDIECENNLHRYGAYISIIQISSKTDSWIIDVLRLKKITPLLRVLEDSSVQKIFHDTGFDLSMIYHMFKCRVKNIFDTQIAAQLLGEEEIGLSQLLKKHFNVEKKSKFQTVDWTIRPIKKEMLDYALKDTLYLIRLRDILKQSLEKKGRLAWAEEEFKTIEDKEPEYREGGFMDISGATHLTDMQRGILKHVFMAREKMAKAANRPVYFILTPKQLVEIAQRPPSLQGWKEMRSVHPIVRAQAKAFFDAVSEGRKDPVPLQPFVRTRYTHHQMVGFIKLGETRDAIAERLGIKKHLVMSKDQIRDIVITGKLDCLKRWQRELVESESQNGSKNIDRA